ncbi:MAG: hypothetical protein KJP25_05545 [Gammaproteobacteria bacterium]|nr:hypothetical protein [Gammaproteobacteria bacterium]NND39962.1 hypothetical protein [Pseudomonadales bacterium]NNM10313.1 hypothetical protein [Pseudomonadales bacterium]RZV60086.1 MAG: hypothetical protein EX270_00780 [Pseudomonadales bacterium]
MQRKGEAGPVPSRCERFYSLRSEWFFATREGASVGPFDTLESANSGLSDYLDFMMLAKPRVKDRLVKSMQK